MTNLISQQLAELQSEHVVGLLKRYYQMERVVTGNVNARVKTDLEYDEERNGFVVSYDYEFERKLPLLDTIEKVNREFAGKLLNIQSN